MTDKLSPERKSAIESLLPNKKADFQAIGKHGTAAIGARFGLSDECRNNADERAADATLDWKTTVSN